DLHGLRDDAFLGRRRRSLTNEKKKEEPRSGQMRKLSNGAFHENLLCDRCIAHPLIASNPTTSSASEKAWVFSSNYARPPSAIRPVFSSPLVTHFQTVGLCSPSGSRRRQEHCRVRKPTGFAGAGARRILTSCPTSLPPPRPGGSVSASG